MRVSQRALQKAAKLRVPLKRALQEYRPGKLSPSEFRDVRATPPSLRVFKSLSWLQMGLNGKTGERDDE